MEIYKITKSGQWGARIYLMKAPSFEAVEELLKTVDPQSEWWLAIVEELKPTTEPQVIAEWDDPNYEG